MSQRLKKPKDIKIYLKGKKLHPTLNLQPQNGYTTTLGWSGKLNNPIDPIFLLNVPVLQHWDIEKIFKILKIKVHSFRVADNFT